MQRAVGQHHFAEALQILLFIKGFHVIWRDSETPTPALQVRLPICLQKIGARHSVGGVVAWQTMNSMLLENKISAMHCESSHELTGKIVAFLREIGLEVRPGIVDGGTIFHGIKVERGVLICDMATLQNPGDLLHEAGHLAVKSAADRKLADANMGGDPAEEMMAIAWAYAAALHLEIPPEVVFHAAGYQGGSQSLLENFAAGRYLALPMLQWLGMAYDEKRAAENGAAPYPKMKAWLRPA